MLVCPPLIVLEWLMKFDPETFLEDAIFVLQDHVRLCLGGRQFRATTQTVVPYRELKGETMASTVLHG
jgi:hypothetical protein